MRVARSVDGWVVETVDLASGQTLEETFHPGIGFVPVPSSVTVGMIQDGSQFRDPTTEELSERGRAGEVSE